MVSRVQARMGARVRVGAGVRSAGAEGRATSALANFSPIILSTV